MMPLEARLPVVAAAKAKLICFTNHKLSKIQARIQFSITSKRCIDFRFRFRLEFWITILIFGEVFSDGLVVGGVSLDAKLKKRGGHQG